ncbi:fibronectin type III domain-containing protein [Flavobacterium sp. 3HN19-14]|uniref:fibronectin type III domain-containing protein n=1 Tax=Flavobacterium sp. 3HN19-14 TaxID=3448133 RepID=UPI003EE41E78
MVDIINVFGQKIFTKPAGTGVAGALLYNNIVNCLVPDCGLAVNNLTVTNIMPHEATISWDAPASFSWDIYIVPAGGAAPTQATTPTYNNVASSSFTTTIPLIADSTYDVYVRNDCATDAVWSKVTFTTTPTCFRPVALGVSSVTTNSASLSWQNGTTSDNSWEILLMPSLSDIPPTGSPVIENGILIPTTNPSPLPVSNLQPMTIYFYYIRTICSSEDKSNWARPYVFYTQGCDAADKCNYKFVLTDSGSNGWNGGRMQVRQNGIIIATIGSTINGAGLTTVTVPLCTNIPFDLYWSVPGTAPDEIGVSIQNPFADNIYVKNPGQETPLTSVYSDIVSCTPVSCPKPVDTSVNTEATTQTSAQLSWTENGSATLWEVYAVPAGSPAPLNGAPLGTAAPYYLASSNPYTINGLTPGTEYTYYVRSICSLSDISTWNILSPKNFTTKPIHDECGSAIQLPVNPTRTPELFVSSGTLGATRSLPLTNPVCQGNSDDDIWFGFTATSTVHIITLSNVTGSATDINHTLYSGNDCASLVQLYCSNPNVSVATNLTPGSSYKIRVYTNGSSPLQSANFDIAITTPPAVPNDDCATATVITPSNSPNCSTPVSSSLTGATASVNETSCAGVEDDDVWFTFVANGSGQIITISNVAGTVTDLTASLYLADGCNLTLLNCFLENSNVVLNLIAGQTYKVRVWSVLDTPQDVTFDICVAKVASPITTSIALTPQQLVTNVLLNNPCTTVSNVTSSTGTNFASDNGIGIFGNAPFPLSSGIVLSTGNVLNIPVQTSQS